jgi:hypothetical protein
MTERLLPAIIIPWAVGFRPGWWFLWLALYFIGFVLIAFLASFVIVNSDMKVVEYWDGHLT